MFLFDKFNIFTKKKLPPGFGSTWYGLPGRIKDTPAKTRKGSVPKAVTHIFV